MCSSVAGSVRVVSMRADQRENGPEPGEVVIRVDRANPVLGNKHVLHNQHDPKERDQVIRAYVEDAERDLRRDGPISRAIGNMAARVAGGDRLVLACWCKPRACHADWIAQQVYQRAAELASSAG